jgi:hypothetical protein
MTPLPLSPPQILTINGAALLDSLGRQIDAKHDGQPGGLYKASLTKWGCDRCERNPIRQYESSRRPSARCAGEIGVSPQGGAHELRAAHDDQNADVRKAV